MRLPAAASVDGLTRFFCGLSGASPSSTHHRCPAPRFENRGRSPCQCRAVHPRRAVTPDTGGSLRRHPCLSSIADLHQFGLLVFNLLPIYPLDGGQILGACRSSPWCLSSRRFCSSSATSELGRPSIWVCSDSKTSATRAVFVTSVSKAAGRQGRPRVARTGRAVSRFIPRPAIRRRRLNVTPPLRWFTILSDSHKL